MPRDPAPVEDGRILGCSPPVQPRLFVEGLLKMAAGAADGRGGEAAIELSVQASLMRRFAGHAVGRARQAQPAVFRKMREFGSVREFLLVDHLHDRGYSRVYFCFPCSVGRQSRRQCGLEVLVICGILMLVPGFFRKRKRSSWTQETKGGPPFPTNPRGCCTRRYSNWIRFRPSEQRTRARLVDEHEHLSSV